VTALERFDEMVSVYLDEALDAEGMAELNSLLATRPEYAARFATLARLHGALYELQAQPRSPVREPAEKRARMLALCLLVAAFASLLAAAAFPREPIGRVLVGLFWFGAGAACGTGAGISLRWGRLWGKGSRVLQRQVEPGKYWGSVVALILCSLVGMVWGIGIWLGRLGWR